MVYARPPSASPHRRLVRRRLQCLAEFSPTAMEVQFTDQIEPLKLGAGATFHGEGILAITKTGDGV